MSTSSDQTHIAPHLAKKELLQAICENSNDLSYWIKLADFIRKYRNSHPAITLFESLTRQQVVDRQLRSTILHSPNIVELIALCENENHKIIPSADVIDLIDLYAYLTDDMLEKLFIKTKYNESYDLVSNALVFAITSPKLIEYYVGTLQGDIRTREIDSAVDNILPNDVLTIISQYYPYKNLFKEFLDRIIKLELESIPAPLTKLILYAKLPEVITKLKKAKAEFLETSRSHIPKNLRRSSLSTVPLMFTHNQALATNETMGSAAAPPSP